ncbi:hypothetical protein FAEPRAM212_02547 [Faecalibacterium prausnitzii M21/2]|uniref:Uncharacterized protein n=1 Tax=Faecalibacterium prausnitzii M21/2 TaxID=411485 RepID=A8SET5_9FIRM|nr:hypothetical protein FAEPRAM212_02547 [Faecalibacterium prausnitzii M21/2]
MTRNGSFFVANAVCRCDLFREKAAQKRPQTFLSRKL